jgi:hypothetical protein
MVSTFVFKGEYKDMAHALTYDAKMFESYYDCMIFSALHGLLNNAFDDQSVSEGEDSDSSASANPAVVRSEIIVKYKREYCAFRRLIILNEKKRNLGPDERIDNAFKYDIFVDSNSSKQTAAISKYSENSKIIKGYVYGGLRILYEKYKDKLKNYTELLEAVDRHIHSFGEESGLIMVGEENVDDGDLNTL